MVINMEQMQIVAMDNIRHGLAMYGCKRAVAWQKDNDKCMAVAFDSQDIDIDNDYEEVLSMAFSLIHGKIDNICRMEVAIWNDDFPSHAIADHELRSTDIVVVDYAMD